MSLRAKLTIGLGFLFLIIFALAIYSSYCIQRLSKDADRILRDNYDSLVYCKNMLLALDDMRTIVNNRIAARKLDTLSLYDSSFFEDSKTIFENNLNAEKRNITEIHEKEYVAELTSDYGLFSSLCQQITGTAGSSSSSTSSLVSAYLDTRQTIVRINDLNMQAVERKSQSARRDSGTMIISMAAIGAICILLAFFYFWYFPFFISNSLSYLANRMKDLLKNIGIKIDTQTKDEAFVLLQSIDLLENKFDKNREEVTKA